MNVMVQKGGETGGEYGLKKKGFQQLFGKESWFIIIFQIKI